MIEYTFCFSNLKKKIMFFFRSGSNKRREKINLVSSKENKTIMFCFLFLLTQFLSNKIINWKFYFLSKQKLFRIPWQKWRYSTKKGQKIWSHLKSFLNKIVKNTKKNIQRKRRSHRRYFDNYICKRFFFFWFQREREREKIRLFPVKRKSVNFFSEWVSQWNVNAYSLL